MKVREIIATVKQVKPNQYDDALLIKWLSDHELTLYDSLFCNYAVTKEEMDAARVAAGLMPETEYEENLPPPRPLPIDPEADTERELAVPAPYDDIYVLWLCAQVDYNNSEIDRYTNSGTYYNARAQAFMNYFNRTHKALRNGTRGLRGRDY